MPKRPGTWSKIFYGCNRVTTTLQAEGRVDVARLRRLLTREGLTSTEISTVFDYLRGQEVVHVDHTNVWTLNGVDFNLR